MTMLHAPVSCKNILAVGTLQLSITMQRQGLLLDVSPSIMNIMNIQHRPLCHICTLSIKELLSCSIQQWESSTMHTTVTVKNEATNQLHNTVKPWYYILHFAFLVILHTFCTVPAKCPKNNVSGYAILGGPNKNVKWEFYGIRQELILIKSIWLHTQSRGCWAAATPPNPNFNKTQIL